MNTTGLTPLEIFGRTARRLGYGSGPSWDASGDTLWRWIIRNIHPQLQGPGGPLVYCALFAFPGFSTADDEQMCVDAATMAGSGLSSRGGSETALAYCTRFLEWVQSE